MGSVPVIDLAGPGSAVAEHIDHACQTAGFFQIVNHGVDEAIEERLVMSPSPLVGT
jgi:isopenicillin N synthase-like dioxygenase